MKTVRPAPRRQKLVPVTVEQRHVPLKRGAETLVMIFPYRHITAKKTVSSISGSALIRRNNGA